MEAATDIAIRVELKTVEASIFMIVSPANEKIVSEYVIENRWDALGLNAYNNMETNACTLSCIIDMPTFRLCT